jgi:hypothetical protein
MKKKVKWPVKILLTRGKQRMLRRWVSYVESLKDEEEVVHICEPETGKILSDDEEKRSEKGLRNCQVGNDEISGCQVGNEERSMIDLKYSQVGSEESSGCQVGNGERSVDLRNCQVGSERIPSFHEGKGSEMRLCESLMKSSMSSYQQRMSMEED